MPLAQTESGKSSGEVVLVIDDDQAVRGSLKFSLEIEGFDVRIYGSADEILKAEDIPTRGCLIIDYYLPGVNGLDLLHQLNARHVHLPAILITTQPTANVRRRASSAGVAIIEKPFLNNALSDAVRESFSRSVQGPPP